MGPNSLPEPDFRLLFEKLPGIYLVLTPDLRMVAASDARLKATMTTREETLGRYLFDVFTENLEDPTRTGVRNLTASLERVLKTKTPDAMPIQKYDLRRRDGTYEERYWSPLNTPILDEQGNVQYIIHQVEDVTQLVKAQQGMDRAVEKSKAQRGEIEALREADALKDHFLSTISHEMKTPLSLITGYIELLEDTCPAESAEFVAGIKDGSRRLTEHIDKMLDYSALLSGTLPLYKTETSLEEIANHVQEILGDRIRFKGLRFDVEIAPGTPSILADSRRLTQMLLELLENAVKFTSHGGQLGLRIAPIEGQVRFDVWDTGPGIPEKDLWRIGEAFSQLAIGDATRRGGLGLGLAIVNKLAKLHGGKVGVVSQVGKGTTFSIVLPVGTDVKRS